MTSALRLYLHYIGISIRAQMQYRASFVMFALAGMLTTGMEFVAIWALFDRFKGLQGWTLPEAAILYGIVHVSFACAEAIAYGFDVFDQMVKSGNFDRLLLRPRSTVLQLLGQDLRLARVGRLAQGLAVLIWGSSTLNIAWTIPKLLILVASIAGGTCIFMGLFIIQATVAFWTIESLEIINTTTYGGVETAQYPLSIYRPWMRRFFTFVVPLACINFYPSMAILGRGGSLCWLSPLVGLIFLIMALRFWRFGVRHYCSTGS